MVSHTNIQGITLSDTDPVRVIGSFLFFTKNEKFREPLALFGNDYHVDRCQDCGKDRKGQDYCKYAVGPAAPFRDHGIPESISDFGKRKPEPFFRWKKSSAIVSSQDHHQGKYRYR